MENSKGLHNIRNFAYSGKHALLPPKCPFTGGSTLYADNVPNSNGSKAVQKPRQGNTHHYRASSESFLIEEQPSWLDDLLNEPETPVSKGGHRRSSSDSFTYADIANESNINYNLRDFHSGPPRRSQDFDYRKDAQHLSYYTDANTMKQKNWGWESSSNSGTTISGLPSARENISIQSSGSSSGPQETQGFSTCTASDHKDPAERASDNSTKAPSKEKDNYPTKLAASDSDTKYSRQQFAQRSRVRKLQYIAELERNVQAIQAEGSEVSAQLEFLNQQNLILSMENKALRQRLESLAQEQLIKYLEHEVLEKEIARLRAFYQNQQQQQQEQQQQQTKRPSSSHQRSKSKDLDSKFSNPSLKP